MRTRLVWVFDHSLYHRAFSSDALNAYHMNAKPGGKQPCLRDTTEMAKYRKWCSASVYPRTCSGAQRWYVKVGHADSWEEKTKIEHYLNSWGHVCVMLPKFHCEFNPVEWCWAQAKQYSRVHCNYSIVGLCQVVPDALDSVTSAITSGRWGSTCSATLRVALLAQDWRSICEKMQKALHIT